MSTWQEAAAERLPQHRELIQCCESVNELWACLWAEFVQAHQQQPMDRATIAGVYDFAWWCVGQTQDDQATTVALIDFFEDLPGEPSVWDELPKHMTREQFLGMQEIYNLGMTQSEHHRFVPHVLALFQRKGKPSKGKPL